MNHQKGKAPCLAFLGTGSDVGKSVLATAVCPVLSDRGVKAAPFKAQNMSNNSGVTPEGLEMGRAQIVQAEACRLAPHVDMNPVLLKPTGESGSQVVVLAAVKGLNIYFLEAVQNLAGFSALILPGAKNSRADRHWLQSSGWADRIRAFHHAGGHLLGICGGYQMLGEKVGDPEGLEGRPGEIRGLGMLPVRTRLAAPKTTSRARFAWEGAAGTGYEIHMGRTRRHGGSDCFRVAEENGRPVDTPDGCVSNDGRVMGTYMHGLFDSPGILEKWLARIGLGGLAVGQAHGLAARDAQYDLLARHFESHADTRGLMKLMGLGCLKEEL